MAVKHRILPPPRPQDIERFQKKVQKGSPDECWEWTAGRTTRGYGAFFLRGFGGAYRAHRFAWTITCGPIPSGLCVCHHCDNPLCQNPAHLFLGTHADNMRDMVHKGRHVMPCERGESNGYAKLTNEQVRDIRCCYATGNITMCALAREFSVCETTINYIIHRRTWRHVA